MPNKLLDAFIKTLADLDIDLEIEVDDDQKTCDVINDIATLFGDVSSTDENDDEVEINETDTRMDELERAAQPIIDWINKYGHPYVNVIITQDGIRVTENVMGIPVECDDEE